MTLPITRDLASFGIRVVTIAPGIFETPMADLPDHLKQSVVENIAFHKRFGRPDEFAALVVECIENSILSGTTIRLDAGCKMPPR